MERMVLDRTRNGLGLGERERGELLEVRAGCAVVVGCGAESGAQTDESVSYRVGCRSRRRCAASSCPKLGLYGSS